MAPSFSNLHRECITPEQLDLFCAYLPRALEQSDTGKFGYVGLIGTGRTSRHAIHDIDVLVFPSPGAKMGEAIMAMNAVYATLDAMLQKDHKLFLATCPRKAYQAETNHIVVQTRGAQGKISTHTLFFPDERSLVSFSPVKFPETAKRQETTLLGRFDIVHELPMHDRFMLDPLFLISDYQIPLIADRYPGKLVLQKTEEVIDYLNKNYAMTISKTGLKRPDECPAIINAILQELDRAA